MRFHDMTAAEMENVLFHFQQLQPVEATDAVI